MIARDPLDTNGRLVAAAGEPIQKLMRLTLVGGEEKSEMDVASDDSEKDEDLPEEGFLENDLRRDLSEEMKREIEVMIIERWRMGYLRYITTPFKR